MAYSKQTWDTTSYVNPTRMNHIEDGIAEISNSIQAGEVVLPYYSYLYLMATITITGIPKAVSLTKCDGAKNGEMYYEILSPTSLRIRISGNFSEGDSQKVSYIIIY